VAALRSRRGASFRLLELVGSGRFRISISVPLVLEYEAAAKDAAEDVGLTHDDIDAILDYICREGRRGPIFYLWRPILPDPKDDHVLEVAVEAGCHSIVNHNVRDFGECGRLGIEVLPPGRFLRRIGVTS
jgi:predicted nucleic acid-binding protein